MLVLLLLLLLRVAHWGPVQKVLPQPMPHRGKINRHPLPPPPPLPLLRLQWRPAARAFGQMDWNEGKIRRRTG
jgi:hypothetical protein